MSIVKDLGDGNGKIGLKKIKLLCTYWLAKVDPQYSKRSAKEIIVARKSMTLEKTHEALEARKIKGSVAYLYFGYFEIGSMKIKN